MMTRLTCAVLTLLLGASLPTSRAVSARSWSASTVEAVGRGTLEGTAIDAEGRVRLAPPVETLWGPDEGIIWDLDLDLAPTEAAGPGAFVALSGPGRVLRVGRGAEPELWYRAEEEGLVTALAADGAGGVYIGLSPAGRVLHARGPGEVEVFVETDAAFVWSLDVDEAGTVWIGTGLPGRLLRRQAGGGVEIAFDAQDDPVRSFARLPGGAVVLGTGGRGRVIRIDAKGRAFVLLDAEEPEIVALAPLGDSLYALAAAAKRPGPARPAGDERAAGVTEHVRVVATPPPGDPEETSGERPDTRRPQEGGAGATFRSPGGGSIYRIDAGGGTHAIWKTTTEMPFDLLALDTGSLLIATGEDGRVYVLDAEGRASLLWSIPSSHASALARGADGRVLVGGTRDARVFLIGAGPRESGSYLSPVVDAGNVADWGRVRWDAEVPRGAGLRVEARSGNTSEPDETWSAWRRLEAPPGRTGAEPRLPAARWFQARVELSSRREALPLLSRLEVFYRPHNRAPEVTRLGVEPAGTVWIPGPTQSSNRTGPFVADDPVARGVAAKMVPGRRNVPIRRAYEAGARTTYWNASDPDDDRLRFSLELRREGSPNWFPLASDLTESYLSWDSRSLPDGHYRVRLTAEDSGDNPDGDHRTTQKVSDAFLVDNTRPHVGRPDVRPAAGGHQVAFEASDPGGGVAVVEVAVDGGEWEPLDPLDGVADSESERYELVVESTEGTPGSVRSLRVRVTDAAGNLGGDLWLIEEP